MGCHTWFYKKVNVSFKEVKETVINFYESEIDLYNRIISGKIDSDLKNDFPEWNKNYGIKHKLISERKLRMIKNGYCELAMYKKYIYNSELTIYIPNHGFYISTEELPHDLFRIGGYPEDKLFSYEETINFIDNNKVHSCVDDLKNSLDVFWRENKDGFIEFG